MKKTKSKNLSKKQLKKLKGGLAVCGDSGCAGNTCGMEKSRDHCLGSDVNTLTIFGGGGTGSKPTVKK